MKNPGWMNTVSKAIPLLFKYNFGSLFFLYSIQKEFVKFTIFIFITDDYVNKLFNKECFADQDHFSIQDSDQIIPKEYLARLNYDINFRAFTPKMIKMQSD